MVFGLKIWLGSVQDLAGVGLGSGWGGSGICPGEGLAGWGGPDLAGEGPDLDLEGLHAILAWISVFCLDSGGNPLGGSRSVWRASEGSIIDRFHWFQLFGGPPRVHY